MVDRVSPEVRSRMMSAVRRKDTKPELQIRKGLHALGLRYRLHSAELPGRPDIVLRKYRAAIFVHGCFWHGHGCRRSKRPSSNEEYWGKKIARNRARDTQVIKALGGMGWRCLVIWECALRNRAVFPDSEPAIALAVAWLRGDADYGEIPEPFDLYV